MNCENLQFNLSLYLDDILTGDERTVLDAHLVRCPLCRQKLDDFRALRLGLQQFAPIEMPQNLLASVKSAVRTELNPVTKTPKKFFSDDLLEFLQMRVMPYLVGTAASLIFGFSLLWILLSGVNKATENPRLVRTENQTPIFVTKVTKTAPQNNLEISPSELVSERLSVSGVSPSINPQGALIALTKSITRGKMMDEEVVLVADVFSNGLANIEEVVQPLDDQQTVYEIEKAFNQNASVAPFVPAFLDKRADSVRVVLKIQRVDISTAKIKKKRT